MRKLFVTAATVAALVAGGAVAAEAKTSVSHAMKPVAVHAVHKVTKSVAAHKVMKPIAAHRSTKTTKIKSRKAFAKSVFCHRGFFHHHGQCVVVKHGH